MHARPFRLGGCAALALTSSLLAADGDLDLTFGPFATGWLVRETPGFSSEPGDFAVDGQSRLVAATTVNDAVQDNLGFRVCWSSADGVSAGCALNDFDLILDGEDRVHAVAIGAADRVVIAGSAEGPPAASPHTYVAIQALTAAGALDTTFGGGDGKFTLNFGADAEARGLAVLPDGRIALAGSVVNGGDRDLFVGLLEPDGTLDTTFWTTGFRVFTIDLGGTNEDIARALAYDPILERLIVVGSTETAAGDLDFFIFAFGLTGQLDITFSGDGRTLVPFNLAGPQDDVPTAVAIDRFSRIVVAGTAGNGSFARAAVARLDRFGVLDPTFHGTGKRAFDVQSADDVRAVTDVVLLPQPGEGILVSGSIDPPPIDVFRRGFLAVVPPGGSGFDGSFSGDGLELHPLGINPSSHAVSGVALQGGKVVVQDGFLAPDDESVVYSRFWMQTIFGDDFESQNLSVWSSVSPGS